MAIVWPCPIPVEAYAAAGRDVEVPEQACPGCGGRLGGWSGYWRFVRRGRGCLRVFVPRGRCGNCRKTHALLPAFCLRNRLDVVETIGAALDAVAGGVGVGSVAAAVGVPHATVRGWVRRFSVYAGRWAAGFAGLVVELGGEPLAAVAGDRRAAVTAIAAAWERACGLPGWLEVGRWRFVSAVCGGALVAANTNSPWMVIGRRRFMPPVPPRGV